MASVEPEPEVYRRRKSYRVDLNDKQRIIGGIGRRRSTANGPCSINDRILQYGKSTENGTAIGKPIELNNNEPVNIPRRRISTTSSPDIGKILSPQCNEKTINQTYFEKNICPQSDEKIVSPQSNEKITSSQNNEKAVNLERNEKFVNLQSNEKIVSQQNKEKVVNLESNDKSIAPQVNEKNFSALNSEKAANLECDEKNVSPQNNEKNLTSKNIEENIHFQCNEKTVKLSNEKTFCAQINEKTINPPNNEKAIDPQNKTAFQNPQTNTLKEENTHGDSLSERKVDVDTSCYQSKRSDRINSPILTRTFPVDNLETLKTQTKEVNPILNKRRSDSIAHSPQMSKSPDRLISTVAKPGLPFYSALNGGHTENHGISLKMAADTIIRINKEEKLANAKKNNKNISPPLSINSARNKFLELEKHSTHLTDHQTAAKKIKAFKQKNSFDSSSSSVDYGNNKDKNTAENLDETTAQELNIKTRSFNLIKRDENANSLQSHTDSEKCTIKDKSHLIEYQLSNNDPAIINNISNIEGELGNSSLIQIDGCSPDLFNHATKSDRPLTSDSDTMLTENFEMDSNEVDVKIVSTTNGKSEDPSDNTYDNNNAHSAEESMQLKKKNHMRKTEDGDKNSEMVDKIDSIINSTLTDCETNFAKNKLDGGELKCPAGEVQVNITDRQNPNSDIIYAVCVNAESNDTVKIKNCNSTWTPSDSDTSSNLDISELSSSSLYEDKESNKPRKLVKKRSRKAEQEYTEKSNQLPETRDDDALECNNSSDECNKSVHIGSSFFDNSINVTDYSSIDASNTSEIKTSLYSEKELSITQPSIVPKSNENLFTKDLNLCDNSEAATTYEISKSIKSSSMTAISNRLPQSLHSFSTSDMGGLESENQACNEMDKLENFKNFKQPGPLSSFTSISKVSTLKLQSFVTKNPMFSPPLRRRSNSSSENHGLTELSEGQHNIIQTNPFSIKKQKDNKKCPENEKLNDNSLSKSYSLPRNMWLNQGLDIDKSSFSSAAKLRTPSEEEDSARTAEVLDSLPNSPFSLIARFSKDIEKFQVKSSVGSKNENYTDRENVPDNTIYSSYREPELSNKAKLCSIKNDTTNYTQNQDEPKNINNNPKVKARPTLNMSSINRISVDESNTNADTNIVSIRRRPSYLNANDEYFSCLNPSESAPENQVSENLVDDTEDIKKPELVADVIPIEEHDSDSDEIELNDFRKIIENPDKHTTRTRPSYGQPGLPNIPEELGNNRQKFKKPIVSGVFPEDTISEESSDDNGECVLDKVDKVKSNHDDNLNTQKHLSLEDLTSDCKKLDGDGTKSLTSLPTINNEEKKKHSDIRTPKIITSSLSDPLLSNNLVKSPSCSSLNPQSTMSLGRSEETVSQVLQPTEKKKTPKVEMRKYVLKNLLETEQSYVQNLSTMISKFSEPLKRPENSNIIEPNVVDEIFFQIPEILEHHEIFLKHLTDRVNVWDDHQIIGDLFVTSFTKTFLMDAYSNFINNFIQAKAAIRQAVNSRPQFARYLEQCTREHREKLTLSDLLITPVQRIPRYKLLLLDMLKYTPEDHRDYENIHLAIEEIEALADRMNKGEMDADQAERDIDRLRDIESTIEGIQDLVTSSRRFIRQDLVAEKEGAQTKKDRCLFLFSDLLVCTTVRRKNNALRRGSLGLFTGQSAADMNRYKFLWKVHLDDVDISKATNPQAIITNSEIEKLEEDLQRLKTILSSIEALSVPHHNVEGSLRELTNDVRQQIQEKQWTAMQSQAPYKSRIDLQALTDDGMKEYTFIFLSTECKSSWSSYFEETKQKLVYSTDSFPPEFQYPVPITKTRSGMQFTCASPSQTMTNYSDIMSPQQFVNGEVWVCNSDGYVGQVCLISMVPEAQSKASLSVCSVRILCLAAVPGGRLLNKQGNLNNHNKVADVMEFNPKKIKSRNRPLKKSLPSESDDDDPHNNAANIMAFDSSDDEDTESPYIGSSSFDGRMSPDGSSLGTVESQEGDHDSSDGYNNTSDEEDSARKDLRREYDHMTDINEQTTMWLGTEDGNIYVYNASDVITQRKSKMKLQHGAPVTAILYFESRVFVALGSGELCIYTREQNANVWQISKPEKIQVSITGSPISCITAVAGRIWCGCQNTIVLVNAATLETETTFTVSPDHNKLVHKIVSSGLGVWVSMQNSAIVRLYHATTYENVTEIDVTPAVNKMLAGADAIIRQHKSACLRVTSMLICKDLLWIGTSAGVILTNPLPSITASTSVLRNGLNPTGSPYGHTGHVRFLTLVEVSKSQFKTVESNKDNSRTSPWLGGNHSRRESTKSMRHDNDANGILTLVLSGGDGYEDFRFSQQSETVGRDDSTNHLLIWRV